MNVCIWLGIVRAHTYLFMDTTRIQMDLYVAAAFATAAALDLNGI